jgi:hypothetical protein
MYNKGYLTSVLFILLTVHGLIVGCASVVPMPTPMPLTAMPGKTSSQPVLTWERDLPEGCQTAIIDAQGQASFGPCSGPRSVAPILSAVERPRDLQHFLDRYQPFEANIPAGRIIFTGRGTQVATSPEKQALAEWASLVHQELQLGRSGASWGLAVALNQEGSNPCSRIQIEIRYMARSLLMIAVWAFSLTQLCG